MSPVISWDKHVLHAWTHDSAAAFIVVILRRVARNCAQQATVDKSIFFSSINPFIFAIKAKLTPSVIWLFSHTVVSR